MLLILDENQEHWLSLSTNKGTSLPQVSHDGGSAQSESPMEKWHWSEVPPGTAIVSILMDQKGVINWSVLKPIRHPIRSVNGRDDGGNLQQGLVKWGTS